MGFIERSFNKSMSGKRTQPLPFTLGDWPATYQESLPALLPDELLTLATYRALVTIDPGTCTSFYAVPGETKVLGSEKSARTRACLLRAENAAAGDKIMCGAPSPWLHITSDWVIQARAADAPPSIDVVSTRTLDNALVNYDLLAQARETLATTLAEGPGRVTLEPGLPDLSLLVNSQTSPIKDAWSPFRYDSLLPVPDGFADGARISVSEHDVDALLAAFASKYLPPSGDDGGGALASTSLSGGRPGSPSPRLALVRDERGAALVFKLPEESDHARQRTFRAALHAVTSLAQGTTESAPELSAALSAWVEANSAMLRDPERHRLFTAFWNEEVAAGTVLVKPGIGLPIALVVRSRDDSPVLGHLVSAQYWLMAFQRTWTRGLKQASREKNRIFLRRGPAIVRINGQPSPFMRFAHSGAVESPGFVYVDGSEGWYWEAYVRSRDLDDGRHEAVLFVSGLSRVRNVLSYGPELLRLMATFGWLIQSADADAEIETVTLWL